MSEGHSLLQRNSTTFPSALTARLRRVYEEYVRLNETQPDVTCYSTKCFKDPAAAAADRKRRLARVLKYYQFLVHEYMGLLNGTSFEDRDAPRGLLVYHRMGLGKTFDALAVALSAIEPVVLSPTERTRPRRIIVISSKTLHANFGKGLKSYLDLFFDVNDPSTRPNTKDQHFERQRAEQRAHSMISYVTMNAHNMADQVLEATRVAQIGSRKDEGTSALDGLLLIVDEAHNFFRAIINSPSPATNARRLYSMIMGAQNLRIMFLTGTPSSKHPFELVPCFNMLTGTDLLPTQYDHFMKHFVSADGRKMINRGKLANRLLGLVSYAGYDVPETLHKPSTIEEKAEAGTGSEPETPPEMRSQRLPRSGGGGGRGDRGSRRARPDRRGRPEAPRREGQLTFASRTPQLQEQTKFRPSNRFRRVGFVENPDALTGAAGRSLFVSLAWSEASGDRRFYNMQKTAFFNLRAEFKNAVQGHQSLTSKARNPRTFGEDGSAFVPKTWDLCDVLAASPKAPLYPADVPVIVKKSESFGQADVKIVAPPATPDRVRAAVGLPAVDGGRAHCKHGEYIVSRLVSDPLLWKDAAEDGPGRKFHLRVYVLVTLTGGRAYAYVNNDWAWVLTAADPYVDGDWENPKVHMSGGASSTRSIPWVQQGAAGVGWSPEQMAKSWQSIQSVSAACGQHLGQSAYPYEEAHHGYEIFGLDVMLDKSGQAWLIEVNHNPSWSWSRDPELRLSTMNPRVAEEMVRWGLETAILPHFGLAARPPPLWEGPAVKYGGFEGALQNIPPGLTLSVEGRLDWVLLDTSGQTQAEAGAEAGAEAEATAATAKPRVLGRFRLKTDPPQVAMVSYEPQPQCSAEQAAAGVSLVLEIWAACNSPDMPRVALAGPDPLNVGETLGFNGHARSARLPRPTCDRCVDGGAAAASPGDGPPLSYPRPTFALRIPHMQLQGNTPAPVFTDAGMQEDLAAMRAGTFVSLGWSESSGEEYTRVGLKQFYELPCEIKNSFQPVGRTLTDKGCLGAMLLQADPTAARFLPRTWDAHALLNDPSLVDNPQRPLILKKTDSSAQLGVEMLPPPFSVEALKAAAGDVKPCSHIVSELVPDPLLWYPDPQNRKDGRKFHIRAYLLVHFNAGRAYAHMSDLTRVLTASKPYVEGEWDDKDIHLSGGSRTTQWWSWDAEHVGWTQAQKEEADAQIRAVMIPIAKSIAATYKPFRECNAGFKFYGLDLMLSRDGRLWLIEVNNRPSWSSLVIQTERTPKEGRDEFFFGRAPIFIRWHLEVAVAPHFGLLPRPPPLWEGPASADDRNTALRNIAPGLTLSPRAPGNWDLVEQSSKSAKKTVGRVSITLKSSGPAHVQYDLPKAYAADGVSLALEAFAAVTAVTTPSDAQACLFRNRAKRCRPANPQVYLAKDPHRVAAALGFTRSGANFVRRARGTETPGFNPRKKGGGEPHSRGLTVAIRAPALRNDLKYRPEKDFEACGIALSSWPEPKATHVSVAWSEASPLGVKALKRDFAALPAEIKSALDDGKRAATDKGQLALNLMMLHADGEEPAYLPATWKLKDFVEKLHELKEEAFFHKPWILKRTDSFAQRGVDILTGREICDRAVRLAEADKYIVSELVKDPLLWTVRQAAPGAGAATDLAAQVVTSAAGAATGLKFHLRVYLIVSVSGGRAHAYANETHTEVYTASKPYVEGDWHDKDTHLTGGDRTDRPMLWQDLAVAHTGIKDPAQCWKDIRAILADVGQVIGENAAPYPESYAGYEIVGLDVMIDRQGKPWLVEVNDRLGWREIGTKIMSERLVTNLVRWSLRTAILPHFGLAPLSSPDLVWSGPAKRDPTGPLAGIACVDIVPFALLTPQYIQELDRMGSTEAVYTRLGRGQPWDEAAIKKLVQSASEDDASQRKTQNVPPRTYYHWAVVAFDGQSRHAVGYIGLRPAAKQSRNAAKGDLQLRYFIGRDHWKKGYATSAVALALEAYSAVCAPETPTVWGNVSPENEPSAAVLKRLGFELRGRVHLASTELREYSRTGRYPPGSASTPGAPSAPPTFCGGGNLKNSSFPTRLPLRLEKVEMSEQQYRQYRAAREKEASEGGGRPGGLPGKGDRPPPRLHALALPGSERGGGSTYYVQSRMYGNYAAPRKYMPTTSAVDPNSITQVKPTDLPDDAFTADTSPKIAKMMENIADSPGPWLIYSQFRGLGGLAVVERFLGLEGYVRYDVKPGVSGEVRGGGPSLQKELLSAVESFPMSSEWTHLVSEVASAAQAFKGLGFTCPVTSPRPIAPTMPKFLPVSLLGLARPRSSAILAVVHFLTSKARRVSTAYRLPVLSGPALWPNSGGEDERLIAELFPEVVVHLKGPVDQSKGRVFQLRHCPCVTPDPAGPPPEAWEMSQHLDGSVCDQCPADGESFWACWASGDAPGAHYHMCQKDDSAPRVDLAADVVERPPPADALPRENAVIVEHLMYDRCWSRFQHPVSKKFGAQHLDKVEGYDACWDCTAECHVWLGYRHHREAAAPLRQGRRDPNEVDKILQSGVPETPALYHLLAARTGEPLITDTSGHGRFVSSRASAAILAAGSLVERSARVQRMQNAAAARKKRFEKRRGGGGGGGRPPTYAVIAGDVSPEDRRRIQATWVSPENKHGDVIKGILVTKAGAEGLDLKYGRQVHILEPYWDKSLEDQVIHRFIRLGALDDLPPEERTVEPFLYLAVPHAESFAALPPDVLEVPVAAASRLPPGTTVDVAFHQRALDTLELNEDARKFLQEIAVECALYPNRTCRSCRSTGVPLFHTDTRSGVASVAEDLRLSDPCQPMVETTVKTLWVTLSDDDQQRRYPYVVDSTFGLGYRFYESAPDRTWGAEDPVHAEIDPASPLYMRLVGAVEET
jgi:RimJ/RimL family protein N-acetyltransferase